MGREYLIDYMLSEETNGLYGTEEFRWNLISRLENQQCKQRRTEREEKWKDSNFSSTYIKSIKEK